MEQLQARICLQFTDGGEIAYLYNRESVDLLMLEKFTSENLQFLEVGNIIEFEGKKYKIQNINFRMEGELQRFNNPMPGISLSSPTMPSDFNCEIGVFLEYA